jgi:hypothetical protein
MVVFCHEQRASGRLCFAMSNVVSVHCCIFCGLLACCEEAVEFLVEILSGEAPGCWRFWARRARISIDILELGSFPSWQGGQ